MPARKKPAISARGTGRTTAANPADFGKKSTPVRERMARDLRETPPEERLKKGH